MTIQGDPHYSLLFAAELMDRVENFLGRECPRTRGGAQYDSSAGGNRPIYESDDEPQVDFDEIETGRQYEGQRTPHCPARGLAATEPAGTEPSRTEPQRSPAQPAQEPAPAEPETVAPSPGPAFADFVTQSGQVLFTPSTLLPLAATKPAFQSYPAPSTAEPAQLVPSETSFAAAGLQLASGELPLVARAPGPARAPQSLAPAAVCTAAAGGRAPDASPCEPDRPWRLFRQAVQAAAETLLVECSRRPRHGLFWQLTGKPAELPPIGAIAPSSFSKTTKASL